MTRENIGGPPLVGGQNIPLSRAVRAGDFVFVSGWMAIDERGGIIQGLIEDQTRIVIEGLESVLKEAGCTLDDVVKVTAWLADPRDFGGFNRIYSEFFKENRPARSAVGANLIFDAKLEVEMTAYKPI